MTMAQQRENDNRWDQAHTHARRGLGELTDHGGTTPSHTLSDIARLADEAVRLRAELRVWKNGSALGCAK